MTKTPTYPNTKPPIDGPTISPTPETDAAEERLAHVEAGRIGEGPRCSPFELAYIRNTRLLCRK